MKNLLLLAPLLLTGCWYDRQFEFQNVELRSTAITSAQIRRAQLIAEIDSFDRIKRVNLTAASRIAEEQAVEDRRAELRRIDLILGQ